MTTSLDGFVADESCRADCLYGDLEELRGSAYMAVTVVGGVNLIRQLLQAGLVDELQVDVMPVLLGAGLRLFDGLFARDVTIEKLRVDEIGPRTSLRFRVRG